MNPQKAEISIEIKKAAGFLPHGFLAIKKAVRPPGGDPTAFSLVQSAHGRYTSPTKVHHHQLQSERTLIFCIALRILDF
jgi:hypothetical protein